MKANTAQLVKVATNGQWVSGVQTVLNIRNFDSIVMDEPQALGGTDQGANPVEFVLAALSGCTSVMIALIAQEKNFVFSGVRFNNSEMIDLRGLMGVEGVSPHFRKVRFEVEISTGENEERISELKSEVERRRPVYNLLKDAGVQLDVKWVKSQR